MAIDKSDPFPNLPRRSFFAGAPHVTYPAIRLESVNGKQPTPEQEAEFKARGDRALAHSFAQTQEACASAEPAKDIGIKIKVRGLRPALEGTKVADNLAVAKAAIEELAKRKRGRPVAPKPWEAEGISRMTWYRRKKGKA